MAAQSGQRPATTRLFTVSECYRMYTTIILSEDERVELLKNVALLLVALANEGTDLHPNRLR